MILEGMISFCRFHSSKSGVVDLKKLRPMILKRIEERAKKYPIKEMIPVAHEVLKARSILYQGVSILLQHFPVMSCRYCTEAYIGDKGHLIRTCGGYRRLQKVHVHEWTEGNLSDILVPVETYHLHNMFQTEIRHDERFDYDRVPAVLELCMQAGVDPGDQILHSRSFGLNGVNDAVALAHSLSNHDIRIIAIDTLMAWEKLRSGIQKLLLVYPAKVCKDCLEVHVGPSGHKARLCGVFKYQRWRGTHFWRKANVDDLVPPKIIWHRRPQDPPVLMDEGRNYYGHAPAVVDLCTKAGAIAPSKYHCLMKVDGLSSPN